MKKKRKRIIRTKVKSKNGLTVPRRNRPKPRKLGDNYKLSINYRNLVISVILAYFCSN